jgi:hypothetical protein
LLRFSSSALLRRRPEASGEGGAAAVECSRGDDCDRPRVIIFIASRPSPPPSPSLSSPSSSSSSLSLSRLLSLPLPPLLPLFRL